MVYEEDFDFIVRATEKAKSVAIVRYGGYFHRIRAGSAMGAGFKPGMLLSFEKRIKRMSSDDEIRRAQKANLSFNALHRMALINDRTHEYDKAKKRLWEIAKSIRWQALVNLRQRLDHKAIIALSYLGQKLYIKVIRMAKSIHLDGGN
jgi:hypothetical protein